mmetsp:Transcript_1101/g.3388  ORF Transcript_1101/g.3388 Transcript_1101/m.3388 type:complete len:225 (+) Transcript_1101:450-1124(+)
MFRLLGRLPRLRNQLVVSPDPPGRTRNPIVCRCTCRSPTATATMFHLVLSTLTIRTCSHRCLCHKWRACTFNRRRWAFRSGPQLQQATVRPRTECSAHRFRRNSPCSCSRRTPTPHSCRGHLRCRGRWPVDPAPSIMRLCMRWQHSRQPPEARRSRRLLLACCPPRSPPPSIVPSLLPTAAPLPNTCLGTVKMVSRSATRRTDQHTLPSRSVPGPLLSPISPRL